MDVGDQDGLRTDAVKLHEVLDSYGIANGFEAVPTSCSIPRPPGAP
jgi:hypothetical protein